MTGSFILKRTDQGGGYLAMPGSANSYTHKLERARVFPTRAEAEKERCPENEVIVDINDIFINL